MREIDLESEGGYEVKFKGEKYPLEEPTIKHAKQFQKAQKENKGDEMDPFIKFLGNLGMPAEVAESIPLSKIKVLTDAIMGDLEKK